MGLKEIFFPRIPSPGLPPSTMKAGIPLQSWKWVQNSSPLAQDMCSLNWRMTQTEIILDCLLLMIELPLTRRSCGSFYFKNHSLMGPPHRKSNLLTSKRAVNCHQRKLNLAIAISKRRLKSSSLMLILIFLRPKCIKCSMMRKLQTFFLRNGHIDMDSTTLQEVIDCLVKSVDFVYSIFDKELIIVDANSVHFSYMN